MLQAKNIRYFKLDLVDNKYAQALVKDKLTLFTPPYVKVHDVYIGGYDEFEEII
jgi:glutaredoxin